MGKRKNREIEKLLKEIEKFKKINRLEEIILFGSYARGDFTKHSDVDLILVDKKFSGKMCLKEVMGYGLSGMLSKG